ncbi:MAG: hypothetical protein OEV34_16555 [Gammaproteobacteria bacterium]|jgi:hypothetical protein|nr:hypothetical protein [Gammaproteobacteria bacterium]
MAERIKDKEDLKLESMFRSEPVADDGFSVNIISRVKRQMWIRRLSMPAAIGIGATIAAKPLLQLAGIVPNLLNSVAGNLIGLDKIPVGNMPQLSTMILGATLVMAVVFASKLLEE